MCNTAFSNFFQVKAVLGSGILSKKKPNLFEVKTASIKQEDKESSLISLDEKQSISLSNATREVTVKTQEHTNIKFNLDLQQLPPQEKDSHRRESLKNSGRKSSLF